MEVPDKIKTVNEWFFNKCPKSPRGGDEIPVLKIKRDQSTKTFYGR
jgi:hypothetical protein